MSDSFFEAAHTSWWAQAMSNGGRWIPSPGTRRGFLTQTSPSGDRRVQKYVATVGVLIRAVTYATLFIGLVIVYLPAQTLSWRGVTRLMVVEESHDKFAPTC